MIGIVKKFLGVMILMSVGLSAHAGHLFTQNSLNTPILLTSGSGLTLPQTTMEGPSSGSSSYIVVSDFDSGDILRMTLGGEVRTFNFDSMPSNWSYAFGEIQTNGATSTDEPALAALSLTLPFSWRIDALAGSFTLEGYRIRTLNGTVNGTGTDTVNQSSVTPTGGAAIPVFGPIHMMLLVLGLIGIAGIRQRKARKH